MVVVCVLSLLLCGRSVLRGILLQHVSEAGRALLRLLRRACQAPEHPLPLPVQEYVQFFKHKLARGVSWGDRMEFINGWYILLIISDMFTIIGSFIKIGIESKVTISASRRGCWFLEIHKNSICSSRKWK